jgi:hypothetical protein
MGSRTQNETHVVTERSHIRPRITFGFEENKATVDIEDLQFSDFPDPQVSLHCTFSRRPLVESSREFLGNIQNLFPVDVPVESHQADILFIMLEHKGCQPDSIAEHDQKDAGNLGVECPGMPYLAPEHLSYPCCNLVTRWAAWFIENDNTGAGPYVRVSLLIDPGHITNTLSG